ncbi:glycerophosphodiester phosphodiesterase [Streptomyces sp. ACA25]|uniref:glycerophosphodiester phosphodiesterase n=1 Tax=Streptomyces sp. ACA25 TaxID=3022596 RepID=UPI002308159C|nr:glycerophosphodiester phosphodiesterase [Streptomyces sp. ACA25]MDB1089668.1 glycerophosphodiester phosphodiesterase [Streptomyces sp. ACA25]
MATKSRVTVVAHRGDPYRATENTLPSIRSALTAGADAVEVDVRITRDGEPVLLHDPTLKRLWGHDRQVDELTTAEVRALTGGGVPLLREVLAETFAARLVIDLPSPSPAVARRVVETVRQDGSAERVCWTGDPAALRAVRAADGSVEIALTWKRTAPIRATLLRDLRPRLLNYRFGLLNERTVREARERGYRVGGWTVDSPRVMRRLLGLGVDVITTNRIGTLRRLAATPGRPAGAREG